MKNKWFQKVLCMLLSVTVLLGALGFSVSAASLKYDPDAEHPYSVPTLEDMKSLVGTLSYAEYMANWSSSPIGTATISIESIGVFDETTNHNKTNSEIGAVKDSQTVKDAMVESPDNWKDFGDNGDAVYLPATGSATWNFSVSPAEAGRYYLKIEYYSCITDESSVSAIERALKIDGKAPFDEVASISLNKQWTYDYVSTQTSDARGQKDSYDVEYFWGDGAADIWGEENRAYYKVVTSVKSGVKTVTTYIISQDINGNSMAPGASATAGWTTYYLQDDTGYHSGYFNFYLADGSHTITLEAERDPVIIKSIEFVPAEETSEMIPYDEYIKQFDSVANRYAGGVDPIVIEGEFPDIVSDSSVAGSNDNTSAVTFPVASGAQLYNVIGETGYSSIGQWAAYKFQVSKSGLYNFGMRFKQDSLQGMFVCRTLKLSGGDYGLDDGTPNVPFAEAYNTQFNYSDKWQSTFLTDDSGEAFMFYFEEGVEYTLYLECSLGTLKNYIQAAEVALTEVNAAYLRILQLTGTDPDEYNDAYDFMNIMPDVLITILEQAKSLETTHLKLKELCGTNGAHIATLETIYKLFNTVGSDKGRNIAANLSTLKSYLGTLGTWINNSKSSTIMVDAIYVIPMVEGEDGTPVSNESKLPRAEANFFESVWFEICAFFSSFFTDYDQMGVTTITDEDVEHINVWLASGRDQSNIWRTMIDARGGFTDSTGVAVSLKLVAGGTLLPSILSRKGPDVYLGLGAADVINYAIRDAVLGINGYDPRLKEEENKVFTTTYYTYKNNDGSYETTTVYDSSRELTFTADPFNKVVEGNFADAAMDTVTISPGRDKNNHALPAVSYGIPRTMQFAMMFYRMDVLANVGREVPESWDDLLSLLPVLQANNMQIGVNYISALDFMIYQKGGSMWKYTDETLYDAIYAGAEVDLDSNIALEAFEFTCSLYSDFSFPVSYDAANRFRTGEMPIVIGGYADTYNQLIVYATEIAGLWEFCSLPGSFREVIDEDGNITGTTFNYDSLASVTATVILKGCDTRGSLLPAWQFTQWETAAEQSAEYGNRIVAIIGPSAKYATANLNAINNLSWTASEKAAIMNQMDNMSSIVNYPGSYIITRYTQFAFLDAVNNGANAVDAMNSYMDAINDEIKRKREEFGLWVPTDEEPVPPQIIQGTTK